MLRNVCLQEDETEVNELSSGGCLKFNIHTNNRLTLKLHSKYKCLKKLIIG